MEYNVSCRSILYWMILSGTCLTYMLKISPNIVIAGIVKRPPKPPSEVQCKASASNGTSITPDDPINSTAAHEYEFTWNEYEQGLMLSAYFWLHPFMEIPGGILAKKYGTKIILGMAVFTAALLGLFLPLATQYHPYANIVLRVLQGIVLGTTFPSIHNLTAKWIPQNERSKFVSAYMGISVAITVTYMVCGYVIYYLGWKSVFYITSALCILWCGCWAYLIYDTPALHPRISPEEKRYILENIGKSTAADHRNKVIPWKKIFTSVPLLATIIGNWSTIWGSNTLLTQAPSYFTFIHGWSIKKTGVLAGLPFILCFIFAVSLGTFCDWLLENEKMSRTNVRKLATFLSTGAPGLAVIGLAYSGCNSSLAFFFIFAGATLMGAITSGVWPNYIDLSPHFASVIFGLSGLIGNSTGALSAIIVGLLTYKNQTIEQWKRIFLICSSIQWFGCIVYMIWGSGDEQPWNNDKFKITDDTSSEHVELNTLVKIQ